MTYTEYIDGVARLVIRTWRECGGIHFYGRIHWTGEEREGYDGRKTNKYDQDVERVLSSDRDVSEMNRYGRDFRHEVGMEVTGYFSHDDLLRDATRFAEEHDDIVLLLIADEWSRSTSQPHPVLYCKDDSVRDDLMRVGQEFDDMYEETDDPWSRFPEKTERLQDEWSSLLQRAGLCVSYDQGSRTSRKRRKKK